YLVEVVLMAVVGALALGITTRRRPAIERAAPRLWALRGFGFLALLLGIVLPSAFQAAKAPFQLELAVYGSLLALACWRVARWGRRSGWNERHMLALASGGLGFFLVVWDPILEVSGVAGGNSTRGTILVALGYLLLLIVLARRVARRLRPTPQPFAAASGAPHTAPG